MPVRVALANAAWLGAEPAAAPSITAIDVFDPLLLQLLVTTICSSLHLNCKSPIGAHLLNCSLLAVPLCLHCGYR